MLKFRAINDFQGIRKGASVGTGRNKKRSEYTA